MRDEIRPNAGMRASWTTYQWMIQGGQHYQAVVKEIGTDAWLWLCGRIHGGHDTIREALACARERIEREKSNG